MAARYRRPPPDCNDFAAVCCDTVHVMLSIQVPRAHAHARDLLRSSLADMRGRIEEKRRGQPLAAEAVPVGEVGGARPRTGDAAHGAFDAVVHASPQVSATFRFALETHNPF
jgi:hypothetical protein